MTELNLKVMYLFPGQGAQYQGMGSDIYQEYNVAKKVYDTASNTVGYDIAELSFKGPENKLSKTKYTQPVLLTHSIACLEVFKELTENKVTPFISAGHSLGEYSALIAAGYLSFEEGLSLVQKRGEMMGKHGEGRMVAFRLDADSLRDLVTKHYCGIGGCNLPEQTVVGGLEDDLESLVADIKNEFDITPIWLDSKGAFHTYHMINAANEFRAYLEAAQLNQSSSEVISNYTARYHSSVPSLIKPLLFCQIFNPVKWIGGMKRSLEDGANLIIEFGGGIGKGDSPDTKRPNLGSISKRSIGKYSSGAIYFPAINNPSIRKVSDLFNFLGSARKEPNDTFPNLQASSGKGNAVNEQWFHLYVPIENGVITENSVKTLSSVSELGINNAIQLITQSKDQNLQDLKDFIDPGIVKPEPYLEVVVGCQTGAVIQYSGKEMEGELIALSKRLRK